ncbi:hypothetical protein [Actinacidiphila bryophytorum]|uniref:Uncharacterized protein n=1 Tax=Actinacidiphila bryophytorum TaxID=1436133 RepID=A0A9W4E7M2_9ACTN|nr:hypothetical protein [Actinacidiphila bryophytorum]MBM9436147.1 hypothetical protein [Actinacidiphila bryophytorum]MBN6543421.1 hypothetical protein [Actinacidiphila bryophytorum]CAG7633797.1 conserved hypothetical protein [Actinacidiphila bryophytorum]
MAETKVERRVGRLARQMNAFAKKHGGADAGVEYLGRRGARVVLVGQDGEWGDVVAPTYEQARAAVRAADVTVHDELGGDIAARMRTGRYEWHRMAGIQIGGRPNT